MGEISHTHYKWAVYDDRLCIFVNKRTFFIVEKYYQSIHWYQQNIGKNTFIDWSTIFERVDVIILIFHRFVELQLQVLVQSLTFQTDPIFSPKKYRNGRTRFGTSGTTLRKIRIWRWSLETSSSIAWSEKEVFRG